LQPVRHINLRPLAVARGRCRLQPIYGRKIPMSLIQDLSDFIGTGINEREIEYKGKTRTFYFRDIPADDAEKLFLNVDKDPKKNKGLRNRVLAATIVDAEGNTALTEKEAGQLPNELANKLQTEALKILGLTPEAAEEAKNE
jgi:hypothetical protein